MRFSKVYWRAAAGAAYAFTIGMRRRRNRALLVGIARHFGYDHLHVEASLPSLKPDDATRGTASINLRELLGVDGNVSPLELIILASIVVNANAQTIFEIGTFDGRTTVNFAANIRPGGAVFTLDLPPAGPVLDVDAHDRKYMQPSLSGARFADSELAQNIKQLVGDSATFDFSPFANSVDVCFIDGAHSYDYVINDSRRALDMIRPDGVILWHDYGSMWPGVTGALNELRSRVPAFAGLRRIEGTTLAILDRTAAAG